MWMEFPAAASRYAETTRQRQKTSLTRSSGKVHFLRLQPEGQYGKIFVW
jgi:hypothetical protein